MDEGYQFRTGQVVYPFGDGGIFPEISIFEEADNARTGTAPNEIMASASLIVGAFVEDEVFRRDELLIVAERPSFGQVVVDGAPHPLMLHAVKKAGFDAEVPN